MKTIFTSFLIFLLYQHTLNADSTTKISEMNLFDLYGIALKNLNFSSSISEDSIIKICLYLEAQNRQKENKDTLFGISEIEINSLCLKGDMGLAISKANKMYEDAKKLKNKLGIGLAFQAIGETYLHSNQFRQADESFKEAAKIIDASNVPYAKLRLLIQQMYVCMELKDMPQLQKYIFKTVEVSSEIQEQLKDDINFYIQCYQTLYEIGEGESGIAYEHLKKTLEIKFPHRSYDIWKYYINSRYYELITEYEKSLLYNDSVLQCLGQKNPNIYIKFSIQRADLYEKQNEPNKSCSIYVAMDKLSDSLKISQYASQIDSLHIFYWVDQLKIENAASYNQMLTRLIIYCSTILIIMVLLISLAKKRNKQLKKSQKRLSEIRYEAADSIQSKSLFLSNMSHDLRTPLSAIVSFSDLLADRNEIDVDMKQQCADIIKRNSELLLKLISDIADISDMNGKIFNFAWKECDVLSLSQSVVNSIEKLKQTQAVLYFSTELKHLEIETDPNRLQQVLINLLTNATKFTPKGKITLSVSLSQEQDMVLFSVEDTGCGIPLDKRAMIFKRFEKLHENVQGAGLGLSICQLIVGHFGGKIWLDSSYSKGTRFLFTHPISRSFSKELKEYRP